MSTVDTNIMFFCLTVIALVAIVYGRPEIAEKAVDGLRGLLGDMTKILARGERKKRGE